MLNRLQVVEVMHRSEQGITRPFLCRASDGQIYWVKGRGAGRRALCCEWIAGRIGQLLQLPVPALAVLEVPRAMIELSAQEGLADLGAGPVFGSLDVVGAQEISLREIDKVSADLRLRLLAFDWWIKNADRTLGERGGNPNLLWTVTDAQPLRVIDHNVAFDRSFVADTFFASHIFGEARSQPREAVLAVHSRLADSADAVRNLWDELPEEWHFVDDQRTVPTDFTLGEVQQALERRMSRFEQEWMAQT